MERTVKYFEKTGAENTAHCLDIVKHEIDENGYKYVVIATNTGHSGLIFSEGLKSTDANVTVILMNQSGDGKEVSADIKKKILENRATLLNAPTLSYSLDSYFGTTQKDFSAAKVVDQTLKLFGLGVKACCESVLIATDAGLITEGMEVLAIAGTGKGADTVAVVRAASTKRFPELRVLEIVAKPRA